MITTDKNALRLRKAVPANRKRIKEIDKKIAELHGERKRLHDDLNIGEDVRIHKGRPYWAPHGDHDLESLDEQRRAHINKRAVDEFFNVQLDCQKPYGFHSTMYGMKEHVGQITESEARKIALAWVLDGKLP